MFLIISGGKVTFVLFYYVFLTELKFYHVMPVIFAFEKILNLTVIITYCDWLKCNNLYQKDGLLFPLLQTTFKKYEKCWN